MIIIVAGTAKSGTNWMRHMINDLIVANGGADISSLRKEIKLLDRILVSEVNRIGVFTFKRTLLLIWTSLSRPTFYLYYMGVPNIWLKLMLKLNLAKAVFTYRDPRDIVLSLMDHGKKEVNAGRTQHHFAKYVEFEPAVAFVKKEFGNKIAWFQMNKKECFLAKYETSLEDPGKMLRSVAGFLKLKATEDKINTISKKYSKNNLEKSNLNGLHLHLNKAVSGRFHDAFTDQEKNSINTILKEIIQKSGYSQK